MSIVYVSHVTLLHASYIAYLQNNTNTVHMFRHIYKYNTHLQIVFIILHVSNIRLDPGPLKPVETLILILTEAQTHECYWVCVHVDSHRKSETYFEHNTTQTKKKKRLKWKKGGCKCLEQKIGRTENTDAKSRVKMEQTEDVSCQKEIVSQSSTLQSTVRYRMDSSKSKHNKDYAIPQKQILSRWHRKDV